MTGALTVEAFRKGEHLRRSSRSRISRDEWVILGAAAPTIFISPFLFGGMDWWSQVTIACLQALIFLVALTPFSGFAAWRQRLVKLIKLPPFWLGGLFVLYVIIQALNPSMEQVYVDESRYFIADRKPELFVSWLPQSILSNFYIMNAWRMVIFWAGAWALVCGLWMGLSSRKAWLALGWMALGTGAVLSLASIAHHLSSNEHLFWFEQFKRSKGAFGPFVYRNQAAAYLYLTMGLGFAMFLHFLRRGENRSGVHWLALIFSLACLLGLVLCPSRGGWIGGASVLLVFLILLPFAIRWREGFSKPALVVSGLLIAGVTGIGFWIARDFDFSQMAKKWADVQSGESVSLKSRMLLSEMTWDMFEDKPWIGWGAGSFRYKYHYYALAYPEIYFIGKTHWKKYGELTMYYRQAHNDHFQFLAEYGVVGYGIMVLYCVSWVVYVFTCRTASIDCLMVIGIGVVFVFHNFGDFLMQNPIDLQAILIVMVFEVGLLNKKALSKC
ncbi:O-antigen ligase family protein [Cerasicoccus maritimus]|uniref:O-antigen ligase family protein n=1 Tax=Cerasicoccus maritimus TaxID=490089 RepID=UPI002852D25A|nr:O-antigen ligase family protein [Cerasicoccus maritimus]